MWKLNPFIKDMNALAQHTGLIPKNGQKDHILNDC